jgi:hypothetical protein
MKRVIIAVAALFLMMVLTAEESWAAGPLVKRQIHQQRLIWNGWKSGQLTPWELRMLEREQLAIRRATHRAWSDGVLTPWERARLHWRLDRARFHIFRAKHNPWRCW